MHRDIYNWSAAKICTLQTHSDPNLNVCKLFRCHFKPMIMNTAYYWFIGGGQIVNSSHHALTVGSERNTEINAQKMHSFSIKRKSSKQPFTL